ncbi:uncharacterized protein LOC131680779 [Topomyia yanbarensis]|uniref:uncharacterized protein LOC131680779 n=1 Tax=Topomyia yanbarensis TaxID=2498891 RepID=UPI00273C2DBF|nr:uncharacterized protein LOC131680779 [Topomyia yanbarensis]
MEQLKNTKRYVEQSLQRTVNQTDWESVHRLVEKKASTIFTRIRYTEIKKLDNLKALKVNEIRQKAEWIENTTECTIPNYLERTLLLGPNFNIQNKTNIPYVRLIADVESAIRNKPNADDIRAEVSNIVTNYISYQNQPHTKQNDWIHKDIVQSRKFLKENPDIYVTRADKGNKTVILASTEYRQKMEEMVNDTSTYTQLNDNPTNKTLRKLNMIIDQWWQNKYIDTMTKNRLKVYNCHPPRIYGLPKIHKENRPLRPVVSTVSSATYKMAQYLSSILNHLVGKTEYHVRNSFEFAQELTKVKVPDGCVMYSLDVVSLYTNVPVDKVYEYVGERWNELQQHTTIPWDSFKAAMKTVLDASFFQYDGKFYRQDHGVPMGSPLSPVVANIVMEKLEQLTIERLKLRNISLTIYRRYVDDCFVVGNGEEIDTVLGEFNKSHSSLVFTLEKEQEGSMRFLDLTLSREGENITKMWFPKQQNGRYLDFTSESPFSHKNNTAIALVDRALKLTDVEKREESIKVALNILRNNNYPDHTIRKILKQRVDRIYNSLRHTEQKALNFASIPYIPCLSEKVGKTLRKHDVTIAYKPCDKIKTTVFTKLKDVIPKMQQTNVVYSIPCGVCKDREYVGQTSQTLEKRLTQHKKSVITNTSTTGLTQHTNDSGHHFDFSRTKILERINNERNRLNAEVLHIKLREKTAVNLQRDAMGFSTTYNGLLKKLNSIGKHSRLTTAVQGEAADLE